jgi:peptidoglycan/LPS O-acetylase OafA/YrhL
MSLQKSKAYDPFPAYVAPDHARRNNFDILRFLLAFLVLLSHGRDIFGLEVESFIFYQAELAVNGFFIISGFLISWSIDRSFEVKNYALKRFMRIYPLYFVVITAQLILLAMLNEADNSLAQMLRYYGANLLTLNFIQPSFGTMVDEPINGSLWTIKVEVMFYMVMPIYIMLLRRFGLRFLLLSFAAAFAYRFGLEAMDQLRWARQIPGSMAFFITGMVAYFYGPYVLKITSPTGRGRNLQSRFRERVILLAILASFITILALSNNFYAQSLAFLLGLALSIYFIAFHLPPLRVPVDISYGVYLWHVPVFLTIRHFYGTVAEPYALYIGGMFSVLLLAYLSAKFIEEPSIRWASRKVKAWRQAPTYDNMKPL